jgi:hypothetical protein
MYTDWGNLKIVSCEAWHSTTEPDPAAQRCSGGMGALGASISWLTQGPELASMEAGNPPMRGPEPSIGRSGKVQVL